MTKNFLRGTISSLRLFRLFMNIRRYLVNKRRTIIRPLCRNRKRGSRAMLIKLRQPPRRVNRIPSRNNFFNGVNACNNSLVI